MRPSKPAFWAAVLALALLAVSFSISLPILVRPFYYLHIQALDLPQRTGWTAQEIRQAYDQVLDFCVLGKPFGTGILAWSEAGRSHFADVRVLFLADFTVLGISAVSCLALFFLRRKKRITFWRPLGRGAGFWAGAGTVSVTALLAGLASQNFDRAFVLFHAVFFPGKDNWLFDPKTDEIILVMPEVFFRNCALLIGGALVICCAVLIFSDFSWKRAPKAPSYAK